MSLQIDEAIRVVSHLARSKQIKSGPHESLESGTPHREDTFMIDGSAGLKRG